MQATDVSAAGFTGTTGGTAEAAPVTPTGARVSLVPF